MMKNSTVKFKENEEMPTTQILQTKSKFNEMYSDLTQKMAELDEKLLEKQEKTVELESKEKYIKT